jgi:hypothetical protein
MTKQNEIQEQNKKLEKMKNYSQVREQSTNMMKAVIIVVQYSVPEKISKSLISKFFSVNQSKLKHKVWHYLNGFLDGNKKESRYLNCQEEEELVKVIKQKQETQDSFHLHEISKEMIEKVKKDSFDLQAFNLALGRTKKAFDSMQKLYQFEMEEVIPPTEGWFQRFLKRHDLKDRDLASKFNKNEKVSFLSKSKPTKMKVLRKSKNL